MNSGGDLILAGQDARIYGNGITPVTFDNVNNLIEGVGQIGINSGFDKLSLINEATGTIDANGTASLTIQLGGPTLSNEGLIEDTGTGGLVVNSTKIATTGTGAVLVNQAGAFIQLSNADLVGGVTAASGGLIETATQTANTLDGSTTPINILAGGTVLVVDNSGLVLNGTINNVGTILVAPTVATDNADLELAGATTVVLTGGGLIDLEGPTARIHGNNEAPGTLDNVNNLIEGIGQIGINYFLAELALINEAAGTIDANGTASLTIQLGGPTLSNEGLIEDTGTGGLVVNSTKIATTGTGAVLVNQAGAFIQLSNADLVGGVTAASGGLIETATQTANTLDGSTTPINILAGGTVLVVDNSGLVLNGTINNVGTILVAPTVATDNADLELAGATTVVLTGGGLIDLEGLTARIHGNNEAPGTLDNVNNLIEGIGQIGINYFLAELALINEAAGTIDANGTASLTIQLGGPTLSNEGLIEDTGTGGLVVNSTKITTTGTGAVLVNQAGAFIQLSNADLVGGVTAASGGLIETATQTANTLDGSTTPINILAGGTVLVVDNSGLVLNGTINNVGTILVAPTVATDNADLELAGATTVVLTGGGLIDLEGLTARIHGNNEAPGTLDNVNNLIEGIGQIGINYFLAELALINEAAGTIDANGTASLTIQLGGPTLSNEGLIEDTGTGGLVVNSTKIATTGTGAVLVNQAGAFIQLSNADLVGGVTAASGGLIETATQTANTLDGSTTPINILAGGTVLVVDNSGLVLNGTINNVGTILVAPTVATDNADLELAGATTVVLTGGGLIDLEGLTARIHGNNEAPGTLDNVNNLIEGIGQIGINYFLAELALINEAAGTIDANGTASLTIQLGGPTLSNEGLIEDTGTGGLDIIRTAVSNTGTIRVLAGGTVSLDENSPINGSGILQLAATSEISLSSTVAAGQTIQFTGAFGTLAVSQDLNMRGTIEGFATHDLIYLPNMAFNAGSDLLNYSGGLLTITNSGNPLSTLDFLGSYSTSSFMLTADSRGGSDLTVNLNLPCFRMGTRILTINGELAVEDLVPGDRLKTFFGSSKSVKWIGQRTVNCRRHPQPWKVWPVRILAGAFRPGIPKRDLWLSPDHAIFANNALVPAKYLINGRTIFQESFDTVTYFHVELIRHDLLLAEGLRTESLLPNSDRSAFENAVTAAQMHPDFHSLNWEANGCAPLVISGPTLENVRAMLLDRAVKIAPAYYAAVY